MSPNRDQESPQLGKGREPKPPATGGRGLVESLERGAQTSSRKDSAELPPPGGSPELSQASSLEVGTPGVLPVFQLPSQEEVAELASRLQADIDEYRANDQRAFKSLLAVVETLKRYEGRAISGNAKRIQEATGGKLDYIAGMTNLAVGEDKFLLSYGNVVDCELILNRYNSHANSGVKDRELAFSTMDPEYPTKAATLILVQNKAGNELETLWKEGTNYHFPSFSKYLDSRR